MARSPTDSASSKKCSSRIMDSFDGDALLKSYTKMERSDDVDNAAHTLEVRGFPGDVDDEDLALHFSSSEFQLVGEVPSVRMSSVGNVAYITFDNPKDLKTVMSKPSHEINGAILTLAIAQHKDMAVDRKRLLLKGIPPDTPTEEIKTYADCMSEYNDILTGCQVWQPTDRCAVIDISDEIPDAAYDTMVKNVQTRRFRRLHQVSVVRPPCTDSVQVSGFHKSLSTDQLKRYFQSKKSNGGTVSEIKEQRSTVIITFEKVSSAQDVLSTPSHTFKNQAMIVRPHYDIAVTKVHEEPTVSTPHGATLKGDETAYVDCSHELLSFLRSRGSHSRDLNSELKTVGAQLAHKWADDEKLRICVVPDISRGAPPMVADDWSKRCVQCVRFFLHRFQTNSESFESDGWKAVQSECQSRENTFGVETIEFSFNQMTHTVTVVGLKQEAGDAFKFLVELRTKQKEELLRKANDTKPIISHVDFSNEHQLNLCLLSKDEFEVKNVQVTKFGAALRLKVSGATKDVRLCKKKISDVKNSMCATVMTANHSFRSVLSFNGMEKKLEKMLQHTVKCVIEMSSGSTIHIHVLSKELGDTVKEIINQVLMEKTLHVEQKRCSFFSRPSWSDFTKEAKSKFLVELCNTKKTGHNKGNDVTIRGLQEDVEHIYKELASKLGKTVTVKDSMQLAKGVAEFIRLHKEASVENIRSQGVAIEVMGDGTVSLEGPSDKIATAKERMQVLCGSVVRGTKDVRQPGMVAEFKSPSGETWLNALNKTHKCITRVSDVPPPVPPKSKSVARPKAFTAGSTLKMPQSSSPNEMITDSNMKVTLVEGFIEQQRTDVIVNISRSDMDLDAFAVSKAIKTAAKSKIKDGDKLLQKECSGIGNIKAGEVKETSNCGLDCKRLYHVTCQCFSTGREKDIEANVVECLKQASIKKFTTISIPSMGTGKLGYDPSVVAETMIKAAVDFSKANSTSSVKEVKFVLYPKDTSTVDAFKEFIKLMKNPTAALPRKRAIPATRPPPTTPPSPASTESTGTAQLNGVTIEIIQGVLHKTKVDVIVNTADTDMDFGSLGSAIVKEGGDEIIDECKKETGSLKAGDVVVTGSGKLNFKKIYHMVITGEHKIEDPVRKCMQMADRYKCCSIAFPAIGTGAAGVSPSEAARQTIGAIESYIEQNKPTSLKLVKLVIYNSTEVATFKQWLGKTIKKIASHAAGTPPHPPPASTKATGTAQLNGVMIEIIQGVLHKTKVDVIVNTADADMEFGSLGSAIVKEGGDEIIDECKKETGSLKAGDVVVTGSGKLNFKKIYHMVITGEHKIEDPVRKCMQMADRYKCCSIAFPAIGTGAAGVSPSEAARQTIGAIKSYIEQNKPTSLKLVRLVIYNSTEVATFEQCLGKTISSPASHTAGMPSSAGMSLVSHSTDEVVTTQGKLTIKARQGDLIKEEVDIIVSTTDERLTLGGLGVYLVKQGGSSIKDELLKCTKPTKGKIMVTGAGQLPFKKIYHVVFPDVDGIAQAVHGCLKMADSFGCKSIAFPAWGTGNAGVRATDSAREMIEGVANYARSNSNLQTINFTIHQAADARVFMAELKQRSHAINPTTAAGSPSSSLSMSHATRMRLEIYTSDKASLVNVNKQIDDFIKQHDHRGEVKDEHVTKLSLEDDAQIKHLEVVHGVKISKDAGNARITIDGNATDVGAVKAEIYRILKECSLQQAKLEKAQAMEKTIVWTFEDISKGFQPYDVLDNYDIEMAYQKKMKTCSLEYEHENVTIDFTHMKEISQSTGQKRAIHRNAAGESPSSWEPQPQGKDVHVVQLTSGSDEYKEVASKFHNSIPRSSKTIVQIERVQNPDLHKQYLAYQDKLTKDNGHRNNVRRLFHGTKEESCKYINKEGFNRSYKGSNVGAKLGDGVYFATNSDYSAQPQYSQPDSNGHQRMYLTKVLVGDFTLGKQGMIVPPVRDPAKDPLHKFNSVVDDVKNPSIFVIFHDSQAYPEHLITFK